MHLKGVRGRNNGKIRDKAKVINMATNKLYIGNLPYSMTENQLTEMFQKIGEVTSAKVITDKFSGRSKGFAFVEMSSEEEAGKAIEKLNGTQLEGRPIVVSEARPMRERPPRNFS